MPTNDLARPPLRRPLGCKVARGARILLSALIVLAAASLVLLPPQVKPPKSLILPCLGETSQGLVRAEFLGMEFDVTTYVYWSSGTDMIQVRRGRIVAVRAGVTSEVYFTWWGAVHRVLVASLGSNRIEVTMVGHPNRESPQRVSITTYPEHLVYMLKDVRGFWPDDAIEPNSDISSVPEAELSPAVELRVLLSLDHALDGVGIEFERGLGSIVSRDNFGASVIVEGEYDSMIVTCGDYSRRVDITAGPD